MTDSDLNISQSFTYTIERPLGMSDAEWQRFCQPEPKVKQSQPGSEPGDGGKLIDLLRRWGVPHSITKHSDETWSIRIERVDDYSEEAEDSVVRGYNGFYTDWAFDAEGRFVDVGIWE